MSIDWLYLITIYKINTIPLFIKPYLEKIYPWIAFSVKSNPPTTHPTLACKVKTFQRFRPMFFVFIIPELGWKIECNISTAINNIYPFWTSAPQQILLFKVSNKNTRKRSKISSTLTIKTLEQHCLCAFIVNFEHILHPFLVFMIFTLTMCLFSHYAWYYSETIA